jgi:hypothetical protein
MVRRAARHAAISRRFEPLLRRLQAASPAYASTGMSMGSCVR